MHYFYETSPKNWSFVDAVQSYQRKNPDAIQRVILSQMKEDLEKLQERGDKLAEAAARCMKNWTKMVKKLPYKVENQKASVAKDLDAGGIRVGNFHGNRQNISFITNSVYSETSSSAKKQQVGKNEDNDDNNTTSSSSQLSELGIFSCEEELNPCPSDIDDNYYDDAEDDPHSGLTDDYHDRRSCAYEFTVDDVGVGGVEDCTEEEEEAEWIVEGFNVLESLRALRMMSCQVDPKSLSDTRILAINDIYLFSKDARNSAMAHMQVYDEEDYGERGRRIIQTIKDDLDCREGAMAISKRISTWCDQISQESEADYVRIQSITAPFLISAAESKDKSELAAANMLHRLGVNFASNSIMDVSLEDTYVHGIVGVLLESIFQSESLLSYQWANGQLSGKRRRNTSTFKPDFVVFAIQSSRRYNVGVSEIKSPMNANSANDGESDLVKLGQEMKQMLNDLIETGVRDPVVGGILLRGYQMSMYKLYLKHRHIYTLVELSNMTIFQNIEGMTVLPSILRSLIQLKNIVLKTAVKAKKRASDKANCVSPSFSPPLSYISTAEYKLRKRAKTTKEQ